jgi:hypothetical protein
VTLGCFAEISPVSCHTLWKASENRPILAVKSSPARLFDHESMLVRTSTVKSATGVSKRLTRQIRFAAPLGVRSDL